MLSGCVARGTGWRGGGLEFCLVYNWIGYVWWVGWNGMGWDRVRKGGMVMLDYYLNCFEGCLMVGHGIVRAAETLGRCRRPVDGRDGLSIVTFGCMKDFELEILRFELTVETATYHLSLSSSRANPMAAQSETTHDSQTKTGRENTSIGHPPHRGTYLLGGGHRQVRLSGSSCGPYLTYSRPGLQRDGQPQVTDQMLQE
jgi:hypothetical protein